jgi:hypothetical protein
MAVGNEFLVAINLAVPLRKIAKAECSPHDSICGEKFPDRLVSKKNFSDQRYSQE